MGRKTKLTDEKMDAIVKDRLQSSISAVMHKYSLSRTTVQRIMQAYRAAQSGDIERLSEINEKHKNIVDWSKKYLTESQRLELEFTGPDIICITDPDDDDVGDPAENMIINKQTKTKNEEEDQSETIESISQLFMYMQFNLFDYLPRLGITIARLNYQSFDFALNYKQATDIYNEFVQKYCHALRSLYEIDRKNLMEEF